MDFQPVNDLEKLLMAAANDRTARPEFYRGLLRDDLFIISEGEKPEHEAHLVLQEAKTLKIRTMDIEGKPHTPVFTSAERISAVVSQEVGFVAMRGETLLTTLRGANLILNPGAQYGKILTAAEVVSMLDGTIFRPEEPRDVGGKQILLGQPNVYPSHIVEPLKKLFASNRNVRAAYLAQGCMPEDYEEPHAIIGIEADGNISSVIESAGMLVDNVVKPGEYVDFFDLTSNPTGVMGDYFRKETKPFYIRKKWFGLF